MKYFSTLLATLSVCGGTVFGAGWEWDALVTSAPSSGTGSVVPIGVSSYLQGDSIGVDVSPRAIAITPDAKTALVVNADSDDVSVVDLTTKVTYTIPLPGGLVPENIAITADGREALVVAIPSSFSGWPPKTVIVLDLTTIPISIKSSLTETIFGTSLAITPNGKWALIGGTDTLNNSISVLDLTTNPISFKSNFIPGFFDGGLAVTPDGKRAIAVTKDLSTATMIDLTAKPNPLQIHTVNVGASPSDVAITPDGKRALVIFAGTGNIPTGGITVLNLTTTPMSVQTLNVPLEEGFVPNSIAITPDGKKAVVTRSGVVFLKQVGQTAALQQSGVVFFDLTTDPISMISTPVFDIDTPTDIAITPDQAPTARFTFTVEGSKVTFYASSSTSPIGSIASYKWDFGDGHKLTTTNPVVTHKYHDLPKAKSHKDYDKPIMVTLTVTNTAGTSTDVTFTGRTVSNNGGPSAVCRQPLITPPSNFVAAEVKVLRDKNEVILKTVWTESSTKGVKKYEIFAHNEKIATISAKDDLEKTIRVHVRHLPKDISDAFIQGICSKYRIRAVVGDEVVSPFVYLTEIQ
jgi:YVTN family beta-propeller protein